MRNIPDLFPAGIAAKEVVEVFEIFE